jgi:hypothetical protein
MDQEFYRINTLYPGSSSRCEGLRRQRGFEMIRERGKIMVREVTKKNNDAEEIGLDQI